MSIAQPNERLQIPATLRRQLADFRRRVWTIKTIEAASAAGLGVVAAFLAMFALDRVWDTPGWPRAGLFIVAALACAIVPIALYRWVWKQRRPDQLARLLARTYPRFGDQLLGVIELARDDSEQARSRQLVGAAIEQVAHDGKERDFRDAVPTPRHRTWLGVLAAPSAVALLIFAAWPHAASNAWARLVAPWKDTPRYTFAALEPIPNRLVVAHGEPFHFEVKLAKRSVSHPGQAEVRVGDRSPVFASLKDGGYDFELPSQVAKGRLELRVGDAFRAVEFEPMFRPELNAVVSETTLPEYLGRPGSQSKDVRGGAITLVKGSHARIKATAGRELAAAWVDGHSLTPDGASIASPMITLAASRDLQFRWTDRNGLAGKEPFTLKMVSRDDEAPTIMIEDLPRQKVILDTELINFKIHARDDFGVKRVGLEWQGIDRKSEKSVATGERALAAGGIDKESLDVAAAFSAKSFGIEPQPIALRVFVEDYLPGRPRVVSPAYTLFVLTANQHAVWLTEQMGRWQRQSLEVRDRELQLYEANKQFRELTPASLDRPENRKKLDAQASAEQANGRRLTNLVTSGEELVKQAMRNPEFGVGHLERWAEMLQSLKDISGNRMPSVADLLKQAARAPKDLASAAGSDNNPPKAGQSSADGQDKASGKGSEGESSKESNGQEKASAKGSEGESSKDGNGQQADERIPAGRQADAGKGSDSQSAKDGKGSPSDSQAKNSGKGSEGETSKSGKGSPSDSQSKSSEKGSSSTPSKSSNNAPMAGQNRAQGQAKPTQPAPGEPKPPTSVPSVVDRESKQQLPEKDKGEKPGPGSPPKTPRLLLPKTELVGGVKSGDPNAPPPPPQEAVDEALNQQRDLLAEFEKVADELNKVLANLEGSTLVKRLKAASRSQLAVATKIGEQVGTTFGQRPNRPNPSANPFATLAAEEVKGSQTISVIMDDLSSYYERRRYARFKAVLDEMKQKDVIGALRQLGDDLKQEQGLSIAQAEFWSDNLDRWAEDLVDPSTSGVCPGSKSKSSLPPSVVLEVLQILEGEINLREETRVADQARPAIAAEEFGKQAGALSKTQDGLKDRVEKVTARIKELPDGEAEFGPELGLLGEVVTVMKETSGILASPNTGSPAVAAETDAIELLLQSKRINPKGGGGGGGKMNAPGGGGSGKTSDSALALVGSGVNQKEVREDRGTPQATGDSGPALPEEFRSGLDQYFNKLEQKGPSGR